MTGGPGKPRRPGTPTPTPGSELDEAPTVTGGRGAAAYVAAGLLPGTRVGHYVLQHELGRGGMGQVFLARDTKLDRKVAIKFVAMNGAAAVERFMAEARVTARCTHPNIVVIHEISEHAGVPYTVLEYVAGDSVAVRLRNGPMAPDRVVAIMLQVARAMVAAHARGIIHRDLKPGNILLGADGAVKVVDFGIAKHVAQGDLHAGEGVPAETPERDLTSADELVGTLHYLAPEHVRRETIDARVDLWAFGVTMFQMLSGKRPLDGVPRLDVIDRLRDLDTPMPRLDAVAPAVPAGLVDVVHRCLEKRADRRMASAAELVAALEALPIATTPGVPATSPGVVGAPGATTGEVDDP
ncbi:MAG: serine/threonine protein kinase, partial [Deltaproteobacteria bacterium]|nr:serine/threonine protein kinase [Kofleriaceae bacterium]